MSKCVEGGYSQVQMQYNLMRKMFSMQIKYDRVFNLTGTDYPLVSNKALQESLLRDKEYIIGYDVNNEAVINPIVGTMKNKFTYFYFMDSKFASNLNELKLKRRNYENLGYHFYFGSEYWALTFECLRDVFNIYSKDKKLQRILWYSFAPSEAWIHTVFFNSKWYKRGEIFNDIYSGMIALSPLCYFEYGKKIKVWTNRDYEELIHSNKMFCRKVRSGLSSSLIKMIDERRRDNEF